jgi:anaerobic dimethyl sulfoxide reductase subunit B (iron-sulfur subunit)
MQEVNNIIHNRKSSTMTYAFTFDSSACSGCKACQIACKDKNNLPVGVLWRRVYEVSGGSWTQQNDAWTTDVFAYNLSVACNHCVHPKCAGVCPANAYVIRDDGIVYIDESKCMGCGYCAWACPYSAPKYNPELRHMTKCNFCYDNIDAGLPPACVAACPLRTLNFVTVDDGQQTLADEKWNVESDRRSMVNRLWSMSANDHPYPLPTFSRTQPHLAIKPHKGMINGLEKSIANREEIKPPRHKDTRLAFITTHLEEFPLIAFTLIAQMAVGAFVIMNWMFGMFWALIQSDAMPYQLITLLIIGAMIGVSGMFSFAHLGTKKNAWRGIMHLKKSWLSREILFVGLFGASWLISLAERYFLRTDYWSPVTALCGIGLIYAMGQVYRLRSIPQWNTWRTNIGFFITTALLGISAMAIVLFYQAPFAGIVMPDLHWRSIGLGLTTLLGMQLIASLSADDQDHETARRLRAGLIVIAMGLSIASIISPAEAWINIPIFMLIVIEESIGRWIFYEAPNLRIM